MAKKASTTLKPRSRSSVEDGLADAMSMALNQFPGSKAYYFYKGLEAGIRYCQDDRRKKELFQNLDQA